jgi:flagellar hook-basal body complex protein FliE
VNLSFAVTSALPELGLRPPQAPAPQSSPQVSSEGGFADVLRHFAGETVGTIRQGEAAALAGIQGGLPLQTVVEKVMAAERTLQAALAVRDKAVSSYLEISRMQI